MNIVTFAVVALVVYLAIKVLVAFLASMTVPLTIAVLAVLFYFLFVKPRKAQTNGQ